jgi:hypothetical protein
MLKFLAGVAVGALIATMVGHTYREREKRQLVDDIARLYEEVVHDTAEQY